MTRPCWVCNTPIVDPEHWIDLRYRRAYFCEQCFQESLGTSEQDESDWSCLGLPWCQTNE